jgi:hypothetical protein
MFTVHVSDAAMSRCLQSRAALVISFAFCLEPWRVRLHTTPLQHLVLGRGNKTLGTRVSYLSRLRTRHTRLPECLLVLLRSARDIAGQAAPRKGSLWLSIGGSAIVYYKARVMGVHNPTVSRPGARPPRRACPRWAGGKVDFCQPHFPARRGGCL